MSEETGMDKLQKSVDKAFEHDWGVLGDIAGEIADAITDAASAAAGAASAAASEVYDFFAEDDPEEIALPETADPNAVADFEAGFRGSD